MVDLVRLELSRGVVVLLVGFSCEVSASPAMMWERGGFHEEPKKSPMSDCSFVEDGFWRARSALEPVIRAEVRKEYAERLAAAKFVTKLAIWSEMDREVRRRLDAKAPSDALY